MQVAKPITSLILTLLCLTWDGAAADDAEQSAPQKAESTLEGTLKVHPKYLYKYYLAGLGNAQTCALFEPEAFKDIKPDSRIRVTGCLGTRFHTGGTDANPSPFPRTWIIYMDVKSVKVLAPPEPETRGSPAK